MFQDRDDVATTECNLQGVNVCAYFETNMAQNELWKCVLHTAQSQAAQYQHERAHGLHNGAGFGTFRFHGFTKHQTLQTGDVASILRNMTPVMNLLQGMQTFVIQSMQRRTDWATWSGPPRSDF